MTTRFIKGILIPVISLCMLFTSACTDEDWKNEVDKLKEEINNLQQVNPSGIVILDTDTLQVVKGEEFEITFRINPSGYQLDSENIELDVENDTYFLQTEEDNQTRASYVRPSEIHEIVSLRKNYNENNEELTGEWVLSIKTQGKENFMDCSKIRLVAHYTDTKGEIQYICSSNFVTVQTLPTLEEGLALYHITQTYRSYNDQKIIPYRIFVYSNIYKNQDETSWVYPRNNLNPLELSFADENQQSLFSINTNNLDSLGYITLTPNDDTFWTNNEANTSEFVQIPVTLNLSNKLGESMIKDFNISYCMKNQLSITIETTQQELENNNNTLYYNLDEAFNQLGFTKEMNLPYKLYTKTGNGHGGLISMGSTEDLYGSRKIKIKTLTTNIPTDNYYKFTTYVRWMSQKNGVYETVASEEEYSFLQVFNITFQVEMKN